jgi:hypothetical protein
MHLGRSNAGNFGTMTRRTSTSRSSSSSEIIPLPCRLLWAGSSRYSELLSQKRGLLLLREGLVQPVAIFGNASSTHAGNATKETRSRGVLQEKQRRDQQTILFVRSDGRGAQGTRTRGHARCQSCQTTFSNECFFSCGACGDHPDSPGSMLRVHTNQINEGIKYERKRLKMLAGTHRVRLYVPRQTQRYARCARSSHVYTPTAKRSSNRVTAALSGASGGERIQ